MAANKRKITGSALKSFISRTVPELGGTNRSRLELFPEIPAEEEDQRYQFAKVFEILLPGQEKAKALENFKKFRSAVNEAGKETGCSLRIHIDSSRSGDLTKRFCWFEVDPKDDSEVDKFAKTSSTAGDTAHGNERSHARISGRVFEIFVSYARANRQQADSLLDHVAKRINLMAVNKPWSVKIWKDDRNIEPGDHWHDEIQNALKRTDLGLLLLGIDFLCSKYITEEELPAFLDEIKNQVSRKLSVPVMLCHFPLEDYQDALGKLLKQQIFRYDHKGQQEYAWNELRGEKMRDAFADELAKRLVRRLDEIYESSPDPDPDETSDPESEPEEEIETSQQEKVRGFSDRAAKHPDEFDGSHFEPNFGQEGTLEDANPTSGEPRGKEVVAIDHLLDWAKSERSYKTEFLAVLGEFGIGKTTTLHQFAQDLIKAREDDATLPLPILFDLRAYRPGDKITLGAVIEDCIQSMKSEDGEAWNLEPQHLIQAVREEQAIAIFDGLDEVMNNLDSKDRPIFIKELWSILPPLSRLKKGGEPELPKGRGRIIMSCRSHFFRDVYEQNGLYTGNEREGISAEDRKMLLILPFTEEQIERYMESCLGKQQGKKVYGMLKEIHNLIDLASRPVLANMIREIVPDLEQMMQDKKEVQGVDLYQKFIRKHLERDEGKHVFTAQHKLRLMEGLAVDLSISQSREWQWEKMEEWLDEFLAENPRIANRYQEKAEVLNQDFRNATAVVRPAEEKSQFRFAHTSLQEYFLACWMVRSLRSGLFERWENLPRPSDETLIFFGQLLSQEEDDKALRNLASLMESPHGKANLTGFRYLLIAHEHGFPLPPVTAITLQGVDLYRWKIGSSGKELHLPTVDLTGAHLAETRWTKVTWQGGSLKGARMTQSEWRDCGVSQVETEGLASEGTIFRDCELEGFQVPDAWEISGSGKESVPQQEIPEAVLRHLRDAHESAINCVSYDGDRGRYLTGSDDKTVKVWDAESLKCLATFEGHSQRVMSVSYDRDRGRYLTGSEDKTVKVWDAESLKCLATLEGHSSWVMSVSYDRDRGRYLTGSSDQTVKVWDAESLKCLATLEGHSQRVMSVSYDRDRGRYLTGSSDQTVKVWDAESLKCLATLEGHSQRVWSVSYDRDRGRYLTGSSDKTVKVWDAESLKCLATLEGHSQTVWSVSYDRDRGRYLTGSSDQTVKVWDAESLKCLATLEGHSQRVMSVSYDRDRGRYLTGSDDKTVKVWDAESLKCLATFEGHSQRVMSVSYDRDRGRYLTGSEDKTVKVWDAESLKCLATLEGHSSWVMSVSYDRDRGRYLTGSYDQTVKVWDAESLKCLATLEGHSQRVMSVSYDRDRGRYLTGSSDQTVKVWDAESLKCLATLEGHSQRVWSVSYDRDRGRYLTGSSDETVKVWDAESLKCLATLEGHSSWVRSVSYDGDRGRYLTGSEDQTVKVWDAESLKCLATLEGHSNSVWSVSYDGDRGRYLTGSSDETVKVWDAESLKCLATLEGHSQTVWSVSYDGDRGRYLTGSSDETVKVWDAESAEEVATFHFLPEQEWMSAARDENLPLAMSEKAHEHLMWVGEEAETKKRIAVPYEGLIGVTATA